ncbi:hypothetical protein F7725_020764 [Dissostichus mawsoni]|uniref:Uncharacterized protein n=1 Tax=Dissostichus mawsoni TaxID=36200 RepID=A0A7J5YE35_DISMA|nr:hypothetical protein F7725_020764 [Dissostichus mawsoni]
MHLQVVIFALSFLTTTAYPLHRHTREAPLTDLKDNQSQDKTEFTKDVDKIYKSHIDSSGLYNHDDQSKNPVAEEMQHKLNLESERLRTRLRQELAELRERLSHSSDHLISTLASMRERLAPLIQQLQSSLSSSTQDLCGHLSLYLQGLEAAEAQAEATPALYQEAFHWMSLTLEHSSFKVADLISDFHTKTIEVINHLKETSASEQEAAKSDHWQEISSRMGQEVSSVRVEAQNRVGALRAELAALLGTSRPGEVIVEVCGVADQPQRLAAGVLLTVVNRKLVTDNCRVHTVVDGALALGGVVLPVQSQVCGVEACPLSCAQVDL